MKPTPEQIHYTMSRVRSSGSVIERQLGSALWKAGFRYRKQYKIFGKPDYVLVSAKIAIFVDSEFWHGYRWGKRAKEAFRSNQSYWHSKIERNRARDRKVNKELKREGWRVIRFWEHEITSKLEDCIARVREVSDPSNTANPLAQSK
ncbi:MAG TPA: very short patch repair endonuclease [Pyrinomonadaceae bacterium]